jgi:hypothetical protein
MMTDEDAIVASIFPFLLVTNTRIASMDTSMQSEPIGGVGGLPRLCAMSPPETIKR